MPEDIREEADKEKDEGYKDLEEEVQGEKQNQGTETEGREELQDRVAELEEELTDKEETIQELRDRVRHLKADFENYKKRQQEKKEEVAEERKSQIGSGGRSERIRTYNFPQGRITDHRINLTTHQIEAVLDGELNEIVESLITADQVEKLKQVK